MWDVVEEHLDDAGFQAERFERAFDDPEYHLESLARGPERHLLSHLEALSLAAPSLIPRSLEPLVQAPEPGDPGLLLATCLALQNAGRFDLLVGPLWHAEPAVRATAVRAVALSGAPAMDTWALEQLSRAATPEQHTTLLGLVAARGLTPPSLVGVLQSDDPDVVVAACHAAHRADRASHLAVIEWLLRHAEPRVREAAMLAGLHLGSQNAWRTCEQLALSEQGASEQAMGLYAALGDATHHQRLLEMLETGDTPVLPLLRALGYAGSAAVIPGLLAALRRCDPLEAKVAADSLALITGVDARDVPFAAPPQAPGEVSELPPVDQDPEAQASLPPLEDDVADASDTVGEAELPAPVPEAWEAWWQKAHAGFVDDRPWLWGMERDAGAYAAALEHAPLPRRHILAEALSIRTSGRARVDSRAFTSEQRAQLAPLAGAPREWFSQRFGRW